MTGRNFGRDWRWLGSQPEAPSAWEADGVEVACVEFHAGGAWADPASLIAALAMAQRLRAGASVQDPGISPWTDGGVHR